MKKKQVKIEGEYQRKSIACPKCGSTVTSVKDSRASHAHTRRRRECDGCGERFSTYELRGDAYDELLALREFKAQMTRLKELLV